jgi:hypothetical protein
MLTADDAEGADGFRLERVTPERAAPDETERALRAMRPAAD